MVFAPRSWLIPSGGRAALLAAFLIAAAVAAPLFGLAIGALDGDPEHARHLLDHVVPGAAANTILILAGVAVLVTVIGTGTAWVAFTYDYPGRSIASWALLLPMAMPTYIVAFAYLDLLHPLGPLQEALRFVLGYDSPRQFRLPDIRSVAATILLLGFVLYPYVYLGARAMFATQSRNQLLAARTLGETRWGAAWRVALPMARPAIVAGIALALLESLNDIGASEMMGVQTMTTMVYSTWITRSDMGTAAQFALGTLMIAALLVILERSARSRRGYGGCDGSAGKTPVRLHGIKAGVAMLATTLPYVIGFVIPASYLAAQGVSRYWSSGLSDQLQAAALTTIALAAAVTLCTLFCSTISIWAARNWWPSAASRTSAGLLALSQIGYAIPGAVLAIGMLAAFSACDAVINAFRGFWSSSAPVLWLGGSVAGLIVACTVRFLSVASGVVSAGFSRIPLSLDQSSRSLGESPLATLVRVHIPLIRPSLAAGALLVLVDAIKELPLTLMLRPMNVETLPTIIYGEAARGNYDEAAIAALAIVLAGIGPVIFLSRTMDNQRTRD